MPGQADNAIGNEQSDSILYLTGVVFPTLAANASATNTSIVPGLLPGDCISWNLQAPTAHLQVDNAYVSANNTITWTWGTDGTGVTGATVNILIEVVRPNRAYTLLPGALL